MRPSPSDQPLVVRVVRGVRLGVTVVLLALALVAGLGGLGPGAGDRGATQRGVSADRLSTDRLEPCSQHATGPAAPAADTPVAEVAAVVRRPGGRVLTVPFEEGWQVYQGRRPGTLVAVCRAAATPSPAP